MKIDYIAILNASLNKAVFVLNLSKNCVLCHLQHKIFDFLKCKKIGYISILNASLNKAVFVLKLSNKKRLVPLTT
jgi:hypothetical protein